MFEEIIEFDEKKIKERNLDINKINAYLDEIHDVPEIKKKRDGHYVGVTCSTELARFGNAIMVCQETEWFRNIIKRWEFWEDGELEEDIIKTHMFPIGKKVPKYLESWIVDLVDDIASVYEKTFVLKANMKLSFNLIVMLLVMFRR